MNVTRPLALLFAASVCACAQQPTQPVPAADAKAASSAPFDYSKYADGTVNSFWFTSLYSWDSIDTTHLVVWANPIQAYLITLSMPCTALPYTGVMRLTSHGGAVTTSVDSVIAGGDQCPIFRIEKLDTRAIHEAHKAVKSTPPG